MLIFFSKLLLSLSLLGSLVSSLGIDRRQSKVDKRFVAAQRSEENNVPELSLESLAKLQLSENSKDSGSQQVENVEEQLENKSLPFGDEEPHAHTKLGNDKNWIAFGDSDAIDKNCVRKSVDFYDVIQDEVIQCQKITEKKCYTSQDTVFDTYTTEVCDETYSKNCQISFLEESSLVNVSVCYTEASRVCQTEDLNKRKRSLIGNFEEFVVEDSCIEAVETVCEAFKRYHVVSDDYADCKVESLDICQRKTDCPKVPKTTCTIIKKNVTKEFPEHQCKKIKKRICGPEDCPIRLLPEVCREEVKKASSKVPLEQCTLTPKQECRDVSMLVPSLVPVEKCLDIPKEVCSKVLVPRKVKRSSTRLFCEGIPGNQNSDFGYTKLMVAGGSASDGKPVVDFEIVDLGSRTSTCKKIPSVQISNEKVVGGLGLNEMPFVCDLGSVTSSKCYMFSSNIWILTTSLSESRVGADLLSYKNISSNDNELVISGGSVDGVERSVSSECFSSEGWKSAFPKLPVGMEGHCLVRLNDTNFMAIGGIQGVDDTPSSSTFELTINVSNPVESKWVGGPPMNRKRANHHCGRIRKSANSEDFNIVVVGRNVDNSVEIFDTTTREWRNGPSPPAVVFGASLVEDPNGGVLLVGGLVAETQAVSNKIYRLSSSEDDWVKTHAELKYGRQNHTAFFVPDNVASCK